MDLAIEIFDPLYCGGAFMACWMFLEMFKDKELVSNNKFPFVFLIGTLVSALYSYGRFIYGEIDNSVDFIFRNFFNLGLVVMFNELFIKFFPKIVKAFLQFLVNKYKGEPK